MAEILLHWKFQYISNYDNCNILEISVFEKFGYVTFLIHWVSDNMLAILIHWKF